MRRPEAWGPASASIIGEGGYVLKDKRPPQRHSSNTNSVYEQRKWPVVRQAQHERGKAFRPPFVLSTGTPLRGDSTGTNSDEIRQFVGS
jgi:hypothetical protein